MTSFGDFSSLLQLGVGTGIGLSLFRAPVDLRVARITRSIETELVALSGVPTPFAQGKKRDMLDLKLRFAAETDALDGRMLPFMIAAVIGALLNLAVLVAATLDADRVLRPDQVEWLLFITVGWFLLEILALEAIARSNLRDAQRDLQAIRKRRAPSVALPTGGGT